VGGFFLLTGLFMVVMFLFFFSSILRIFH
jgi:hypothetical protein